MKKKKKKKVLELKSGIKSDWNDLKKTIHAEKASSVAELKHFCKEDRAKIPPQWCERAAASYYKCLITAVAAKGDTSSY